MPVQKNKKVGDIFASKDYTKFKVMAHNREINNIRVSKLASNMKKNGWLSVSTITVNKKNEIIDGQHRYYAAKVAGVEYKFTIVNTASTTEMMAINKNQRGWAKVDYIHGFVSDGNENYKILDSFRKSHPNFSLTEIMMFLVNGYKSIDMDTFENGKFKVGSIETAELWAEQINSLKPYFPDGYNKTNFVRALIKIMERRGEFKFKEFLHKVKMRPGMLYMCGNMAQYIDMIETLYNYKRVIKINLRFLD